MATSSERSERALRSASKLPSSPSSTSSRASPPESTNSVSKSPKAKSKAKSKSKKRPRDPADSLEAILGVSLSALTPGNGTSTSLSHSNDTNSGTCSGGDGTSSAAPLDLTLSPQRAPPPSVNLVPSQRSPFASATSPSASALPSRKRRRRKVTDSNAGSNLGASNPSAPAVAQVSTRAKQTRPVASKSGAAMSYNAPTHNGTGGRGGGGRGRRSSRRQRVPHGLNGFGGGGGGGRSSLADETEVFILGDPSGGFGVGGYRQGFGGAFGVGGLAAAGQQQQQQNGGVVYQFSDYGSWNDMLPHASQVIEKARLAGQSSVRLVAMGRPYLYDLANMVQTNEHTQVQRPIRRIERDPPAEKPKSDAPEDEHKMADVTADELWVRVKLTDEQIKAEQCSLCMEDFKENSDAGRLRDCSGHYFHTDCGLGMTTAEYVLDKKKCPVCGIFYGTLIGNCPDGIMRVRPTPMPVPGHECDRAWEVQFSFPGGVQSDKHPNPGSQLHPDSRVAYLPDTEEGREVLELFKRGWKQRILYTVGYSQTRQIDGVIIYNGIHMKTQVSGGMHGYPDKGYLTRVKEEFAVKGILPRKATPEAEAAGSDDDEQMVDVS